MHRKCFYFYAFCKMHHILQNAPLRGISIVAPHMRTHTAQHIHEDTYIALPHTSYLIPHTSYLIPHTSYLIPQVLPYLIRDARKHQLVLYFSTFFPLIFFPFVGAANWLRTHIEQYEDIYCSMKFVFFWPSEEARTAL